MLVSNNGPCYEFEPYSLPVFGTYNDYGYVKIEEDENTKAIEKYSGLTIDYFINEFEIMREPSSQFFDAGMYIHRPVYDAMVKQKPRASTHFVKKLLLEEDVGFDEYIGEFKKLSRNVVMMGFKLAIEGLMFKTLITDEECERLVNLYGLTKNMNENLIHLFTDFHRFLSKCIFNNTVLMPWAQHTQHGEISKQLTIYREYVKLLEVKELKYKKMMEADEDY
jgi:hypothetical protein